MNHTVATEELFFAKALLSRMGRRWQLNAEDQELPTQTVEEAVLAALGEAGGFSGKLAEAIAKLASSDLGQRYYDFGQKLLPWPLETELEAVDSYLQGLPNRFYSALYLLALASNEPLGESKKKLSGTDLRYFSTKSVITEDNYSYAKRTVEIFFHTFISMATKSVVIWRTASSKPFVEDRVYTLTGGTIKDYKQRSIAPMLKPLLETRILRPKFFDTETGELF